MAAFKAMMVLLEEGARGEPELAYRAAALSGDELLQVGEERPQRHPSTGLTEALLLLFQEHIKFLCGVPCAK
jgi:hypothetical protein